MRELFARSITARLRSLTVGLRSLDRALKSNPSPDGAALLEFRHALDNVRMTAWTASELLTARQNQKDPQAVISFLTAERLRRFGQMARDLCSDLEQDEASWSVQAVNDLENALVLLREQLRIVSASRETRPSARVEGHTAGLAWAPELHDSGPQTQL